MKDLVPHALRDGVERLREGINETLDRFTGQIHRLRGGEPRATEGQDDFPAPRAGVGFPALNMEEHDDEIRVAVELPGFNHDDFRVEVVGQTLRIAGERQDSSESKEGRWHYAECRYGAFSRSLRLPCEVDADKVKAHFRNGLLKIRLPKTEDARSRRIAVEVQ